MSTFSKILPNFNTISVKALKLKICSKATKCYFTKKLTRNSIDINCTYYMDETTTLISALKKAVNIVWDCHRCYGTH